MTRDDRLDLLNSVKCILEVADDDLSWDQLPNRYRIQDAIKYINTLIKIHPVSKLPDQ